MSVTFRHAGPEDCPVILDFIKKLAEHQGHSDKVVITENDLHRALFEDKLAYDLLAEDEGTPVGHIFYFFNFSTFTGRKGLYIEDLFVLSGNRGKGYGKALLREIARIALKEGCEWMEWLCLDSNEPTWKFYVAQGAKPQEDWTVFRMDSSGLKDFTK